MNGGMIRMRNAFSPLLQSAEGYQNHSITRSSDPRDRAAGRAWEPGQALFPVVGMAGVDRPGTVQLLDEQHPHHGMRQGQVRQADALVRSLPEGGVQSVRAANDQGHVVALQLPALQALGQGLGRQIGAALIEHDDARAARNGGTRIVVLDERGTDRKSTRLNSSHLVISYAVFCLKKKKSPAPR